MCPVVTETPEYPIITAQPKEHNAVHDGSGRKEQQMVHNYRVIDRGIYFIITYDIFPREPPS